MSDQLGPHASEPPAGGDLGSWAAGEVTMHEEICGLRYQRIDERMERIEQGIEAISKRYNDSVKYVMGNLAADAKATVHNLEDLLTGKTDFNGFAASGWPCARPTSPSSPRLCRPQPTPRA